MKWTAVISADWIAMVGMMDDATAGRLFKQMLSIMNGSDEPDPDDLKMVLAFIRRFWADQEEKDARAIEQRRQAALSRWHKEGVAPVDEWTEAPAPKQREKKIKSVVPYSSEFEEFWRVYPKHKGKFKAREAWKRLLDGGFESSYLINKATEYAKECSLKHVEDRYIKRPQGWLNDGRFDDDFFTGTVQANLDAITDGLDSIFD